LLKTKIKPQFERPVQSLSTSLFPVFQGSNRGQFQPCFSVFTVRSAEGRKPLETRRFGCTASADCHVFKDPWTLWFQTSALYRFLFAQVKRYHVGKLQGCARLFRAFPELLYPVTYVVVLPIHLTPRCAILKASHANCKVLQHDFGEAEGSALLDRRAIQDSPIIDCPEEQRSSPLAIISTAQLE